MADTSMVDLADLIEQRSGIRLGKAYGNGEKRTRKGPCPFCKQGTDRFAVFVNGIPQHYHCGIHGSSGCGAHGDAVTFLREYEGLNYFEACEELDIDPGSEYVHRESSALDSTREKPPCKDWQKQAGALIHTAQKLLRSKSGAHALEYLHSRGFTDETIEKAKLGYIPLNAEGRWFLSTFEEWGLKKEDYPDEEKASGYKDGVWLYEGILIPRYEGETIWKLTVRRLTGWKEGDPKYPDILGSGEGLFNVDAIQPGKPVVLCEGPLDALTGIQQCSDLAAFVATGSVVRGRTVRWESQLWLVSPVLITYDDDAPDKHGKRAGDEGADHWLKALPDASRWLPWAHDVNDMLTSGVDLRAWLKLGLDSAALEQDIIEDEASQLIEPTEQEPSVPTPAHVNPVQEEEDRHFKHWPAHLDSKLPCYRCGGNILMYAERLGEWMCLCYFDMQDALEMRHFKPKGEWAEPVISKCCRCDNPAIAYGNVVKPYCVDCSPVQVPTPSEEVSA
jgi:CHC2 zinc finger/DNA primase catalytic core, N-terminal domain